MSARRYVDVWARLAKGSGRRSRVEWQDEGDGVYLVDPKARGLAIAPELATGDGALGFWKTLEAVSPMTRHQRCTVHKTANVLDKLPKSAQPTASPHFSPDAKRL